MTERLLEALGASGIDPVLVQRRFSRAVQEVGRPSARKALAVPALVLRLARTVAARRPESVVFFLTNRAGSFLVDSVLLALLRRLRVPTVLYVHTVGFHELARRGRLWRALVRSALKTGPVVTLGEALRSDVAPFTRVPGHVIPNASPAPPLPPGPRRRPDGALHAAYLSNLQPEKGADVFVRTAAALVAGGGSWRFTLAGGGADDRIADLRAQAERAGLTDVLEVRGPVDEAGRWALLDSADVLVFPSTYPFEAQPLVIVEAMATGTPVVAFDVGGVRDLVEDGRTGRLVPPGDEPALVAAVTGLASDRDRRSAASEAARQRFTASHSLPAYRAAWKDLLDMTGQPSAHPADFANSPAAFRALVRADWRANPRDVKSRAILLGFRLAQWAMTDPDRPRRAGLVVVAAYRFWTEFLVGLELRPKTRIGGGLTIYHGYGLVVNDHARIGAGVILRNGVTIGQRTTGGPSPTIGDGVEFGAGALVLGDITVGANARIGAGAVVLTDVPPGAAAVGNPARIVPPAR